VQTGISLLLSSTIGKIFFPGVAPSFDINLYMEPSSGRRFHPLKATKCEKKKIGALSITFFLCRAVLISFQCR
jgi:hypothetical protein